MMSARTLVRCCLAGMAMAASGLSHAQLPVVPQLVAVDTSGSDTAGFGLPAAPLRSAVTQVRLRFDVPMATPLPTGFRVVAAGPDGVLDSAACAGPLGDDLAIPVLGAFGGLVDNEIALRLDAPAGLPRGRYRVIVCDGLLSQAGVALDGDDADALPGGVALRDFAVGFTSLLANPGFDSGTGQWDGIGLEPDLRDADGAAGSGSARLRGLLAGSLDSATCAAVPAGGAWRVRFRYRSLADDVRLFLRVHTGFAGDLGEAGCVGPGIAREFLVEAAPADGFATFDSGWQPRIAMPLAEVSLLAVAPFGVPAIDVLVDDVEFQFDADTIFRDAFER